MVNLLDSGATRGMVLTGLTSSDEWLGAIVTGLYQETLGRSAGCGGAGLLGGDPAVAAVHGGPGGGVVLRRARVPEDSGSVEEWVDDLYEAILGRAASMADLNYWVEPGRGPGAVVGGGAAVRVVGVAAGPGGGALRVVAGPGTGARRAGLLGRAGGTWAT